MATVVLMGAGASFGSVDGSPGLPPLGNGHDGLFARLEALGGVASTLSIELKARFRDDFEVGMAEYCLRESGNIMKFQREMAAYLAAFRPGPANTYLQLIKSLGSHRVLFATLNYDLLFEQAALALGYKAVNYGVAKKCVGPRLLKPHGSCNFWPTIPPGNIADCTFENYEVAFDGEICPLSREQTLKRCGLDSSLSPAMAIYAVGKAVKVSPGFVMRHQELLRSALEKAGRVFIVGVKVHVADQHIWGAIAGSPARVTYFGRSPDRSAFDTWSKERGRDSHFVEATFAECVPIIRSMVYA